VELGHAIGADAAVADLDLRYPMLSGGSVAERTAFLPSKTLHVPADSRLGHAKVHPVGRQTRVEPLRFTLCFGYGGRRYGVEYPPAAVAEAQVDALLNGVLSNDKTRRPLHESAVGPEAPPVHEPDAARDVGIVQAGAGC
jgi:hypothetical protein